MATISEPPRGSSNVGSQREAVSPAGGWLPANPAPLGLCGFGITTFVLSMINANLVSGTDVPVVLGLAIAYGGLAQLLAGMWEFRAGNTFGAVAFTSYGAFWISYFFLVSFDAKLLGASHAGAAIGLYLWSWGIFTSMMFLCSFGNSRAVQAVFLALAVTFILLGIGSSGGHTSITEAGGWAGIITAGLALYAACGEIMAAVYKRDVLWLGRPASKD